MPAGQTWTRPDGVVFQGEMACPWKPWQELDAAQRAYAQEQLESLSAQNSEYEAALAEIEAALGGERMTIEERKQRILAKIAEMKAEGADMQAALESLEVKPDEEVE